MSIKQWARNWGLGIAIPMTLALTSACPAPEPNEPPSTEDDSYQLAEDQILSVTAADGVLANDTDPEGQALTARLITDPGHGVVTIAEDGSFDYTPEADYYGDDSFDYEAVDGKQATVGTVSLTIEPVNDAPVATGDAFEASEDAPLVVGAGEGVLANDEDIDGDALTVILTTAPEHGALTLNADGSFEYTSDLDYNGADAFEYAVSDGIESTSGAVELTITPVDDPPLIAPAMYAGTEDTELSVDAPGVLVQTMDVDGETVTAVLEDPPAQGMITLNADGSFTYQPAANDNGEVTFTFTVTDGVTSVGPETVTIDLAAVADAPTAVADAFDATEDVMLSVAAAAGVLANDTDADGDAFTATLVTGPQHGTLAFQADGSFTYMPEANFNGNDTFEYKINDGALDSLDATVTIAVAPVNDPPVSAADAYMVDEDNTLSVMAAAGVLANDTDIDDDALTAQLVTDVQHGTLALNADGSFTYTPDENYFGTDTFTYRADDGTMTSSADEVTITIAAVDDAPLAADDTFTASEDTTLLVQAASGVLANDEDVEGAALTATLVTQPAHGALTFQPSGAFQYIPDANYFGDDTFTYRVSDGGLDSLDATVTIDIAPVNDRPVSVNDSYTVAEDNALSVLAAAGVLANDTDIENDTLSAVVVVNPAHGTLVLNGDGSFDYTPDANFFGIDSFTYSADDGDLASIPVPVTITVTAVDDAPVAADDTYYVLEHIGSSVGTERGLRANDSDVDGDTFVMAATNPDHGTVTVQADGAFDYDPDDGYLGMDSFDYTLSDGVTEVTATVTLHVLDKPDALWGQTYHVDNYDRVGDVTVLPDGRIVAVGGSEDGGLPPTLGGFVVWMDADGNELARYDTAGLKFDSVTWGPDGSVYVGGSYPGSLSRFDTDGNELWTTTSIDPISIATLSDGSIAVDESSQLLRVDANGDIVWFKGIKKANGRGPNSLHTYGMNIVLTGRAFNNAHFGEGEANDTLLKQYRNYDTSPFIARFNGSDGTLQWVRHAPAPDGSPLNNSGSVLIAQDSEGVAVTYNGTSYVMTGIVSGSAEFGWDEADSVLLQTDPAFSGFVDRMFVASYSPAGDFEWVHLIETGAGRDIATLSDGSVLVLGGGGAGTIESATRSFELQDGGLILIHYDASGELQWAWTAATGYTWGRLAIADDDSCVVGGWFTHGTPLDIAPGEPSNLTLQAEGTSTSHRDGYVFRLDSFAN